MAKTATASKRASAAVEAQPHRSLAEMLDDIDAIVETCSAKGLADKRAVERASLLATGIRRLRELVSLEIVEGEVMELMNTRIGFLTDRDPARAKRGERIELYPVAVVRDCLIEALLHEVSWVGNEFNIIAGGFYITKEGLSRKVHEFSEVTNVKLTFGVPARQGSTGALVPATASWARDGIADKIECRQLGEIDDRIPVKTAGDYTSVDAILGKAERKLLARVYRRLAGSHISIPTGEIDQNELVAAAAAKAQPTADRLADQLAPKPEAVPEGEPEAEPESAPVKDPPPDPNAPDDILICPKCRGGTWSRAVTGTKCPACHTAGTPAQRA